MAANAAELPYLGAKRVLLDTLLLDVRSLTAEQASLAARKQDVSRRLAELMREGNMLVAFLDTGVKQQYGNRAEKLVEFGLQPFRSWPRLLLVGPDGERRKPTSTEKEPPPAQPATPSSSCVAGNYRGLASASPHFFRHIWGAMPHLPAGPSRVDEHPHGT